ncbi:MAG TPA: GAF domain-containing SpoIIE family protein phosphatase [Pyrinomonadaceae bacterium]|nr:GAF domain-containing SpoIIE family protein phosphatase [Pyrinomonadaceae bacterium]
MKRLRRMVYRKVNGGRKAAALRLSPARLLLVEEIAALCAMLGFWLGGGGLRSGLAGAATALGLTGLLLAMVLRRVSNVIDRRFLQEKYDEQRILADLGHAARAVTTIEQLFKLVVDNIQDALHTENVSIFVRDDASGNYVCGINAPHIFSPQASPARPLSLERDAFVVRRLKKLGIPLGVGPKDFEVWAQALASDTSARREAREDETDVLRQINSRLLVQIMMKDELVGIISLGPRIGDKPYSPEDKRMLMAIAGQMAFIIENAKLVQRMVEEERLRRELSVATEVQRRLFPAHPPEVASLELAGFCQPAREVGGDYYDFLSLDDGQIGLAVADVAGKGISAALLMSTVQASLRSQAIAARGTLSDLVSTMNRLMYSSTGAESYATFFYAQFDELSRRLTYVNAGHNPPFLMRPRREARAEGEDLQTAPAYAARRLRASIPVARGEAPGAASAAAAAVLEAPSDELSDASFAEESCLRLTGGGPVIGVFRSCVYEQESVQLRSGDVLLAYTDGVTEAFNQEGEEFGEERLEELLRASLHLSAEEVRDRLVRGVRDWCTGAPQHDDLTFIVLKVK